MTPSGLSAEAHPPLPADGGTALQQQQQRAGPGRSSLCPRHQPPEAVTQQLLTGHWSRVCEALETQRRPHSLGPATSAREQVPGQKGHLITETGGRGRVGRGTAPRRGAAGRTGWEPCWRPGSSLCKGLSRRRRPCPGGRRVLGGQLVTGEAARAARRPRAAPAGAHPAAAWPAALKSAPCFGLCFSFLRKNSCKAKKE